MQNYNKFIKYYAYMQDNEEKYNYLKTVLGNVFKEIRMQNSGYSCNKAEAEFDIGSGNLSRIENGKTNPSFTTMWKAAESTGQKLSYIVSLVEDLVGENFSLTD